MARLFYCTFNRKRELFYDGYFVECDDGKIIGYTHDGILTGTITSEICETNEKCYTDYPVKKGYIEDKSQLVYDYEQDKITIKLYEISYDYETEETIYERMWKRADMLPISVQTELEKFLEEGETDT